MLCKDLYKGENSNPLCTMYFVNNQGLSKYVLCV